LLLKLVFKPNRDLRYAPFLALIEVEILFARLFGGQKDCIGKQETAPENKKVTIPEITLSINIMKL